MTRNSYSAEFKQQTLDKVSQRKELTIADIALDLNMNHTTLKSWMKQQHSKPTPIAKRPENYDSRMKWIGQAADQCSLY